MQRHCMKYPNCCDVQQNLNKQRLTNWWWMPLKERHWFPRMHGAPQTAALMETREQYSHWGFAALFFFSATHNIQSLFLKSATWYIYIFYIASWFSDSEEPQVLPCLPLSTGACTRAWKFYRDQSQQKSFSNHHKEPWGTESKWFPTTLMSQVLLE